MLNNIISYNFSSSFLFVYLIKDTVKKKLSIPFFVLVKHTGGYRADIGTGTDEQQHHRQQALKVEDGRLKK